MLPSHTWKHFEVSDAMKVKLGTYLDCSAVSCPALMCPIIFPLMYSNPPASFVRLSYAPLVPLFLLHPCAFLAFFIGFGFLVFWTFDLLQFCLPNKETLIHDLIWNRGLRLDSNRSPAIAGATHGTLTLSPWLLLLWRPFKKSAHTQTHTHAHTKCPSREQ